MKKISLEINGEKVEAKEGMTILEAARGIGIEIPTLCYYKALKPRGACRLCVVELTNRVGTRLVASCQYPVEDGLVVNTDSTQVMGSRRLILELMLARCPTVPRIQELAQQYGISKPRFKVKQELCILCGLCARICEEVVGVAAINFLERGTRREVTTPFGEISQACIGCGACAKVCPTNAITLEDLYGRNVVHSEALLGPNAAIRVTSRQAVPNVPVINTTQCIHFKTGKCKLCERFCEREAINHEMEDEYEEIEVGNIIVATGFSLFNPAAVYRYGYGRFDNVITGLEFERMVNASGPTGGDIVLTDGSHPRSVAIVHCVGSRDEKHHEYCSRVCCMYSMKFAHLLREHLPDVQVYEFYIDMRSFGKGYEEFYNRVLREGTIFIRGRPAEITNIAEIPEEEGKLVVQFEDTLVGKQRRQAVDMVVLSCALEAQPDAESIARLFNISRSADGFFLEMHPKLAPVATMSDGIFVAGCCQSPKDIPDTVTQGSAAASEVLAMISKGSVAIDAITASVNERICGGCRLCEIICPYKASSFDEEKGVCRINEALCKGCGSCVTACPSKVIGLRHFTDEQILAQMEGMLIQ